MLCLLSAGLSIKCIYIVRTLSLIPCRAKHPAGTFCIQNGLLVTGLLDALCELSHHFCLTWDLSSFIAPCILSPAGERRAISPCRLAHWFLSKLNWSPQKLSRKVPALVKQHHAIRFYIYFIL